MYLNTQRFTAAVHARSCSPAWDTINFSQFLHYMLYYIHIPLHVQLHDKYMLDYMPLHPAPFHYMLYYMHYYMIHYLPLHPAPFHYMLYYMLNYMLNYMLHYILNYMPLHALHGIKMITCFLHSLLQPRSLPPEAPLVLKIVVVCM
jgi:hypothetical protein